VSSFLTPTENDPEKDQNYNEKIFRDSKMAARGRKQKACFLK
jgi:hypothetical protein